MREYFKKLIVNNNTRQKFYRRFTGHERILELGCGRGFNADYIKKQFPQIEYHGVDILPENEISSTIKYKSIDLDIHSLPYQSDYFDIIIFTHVIEHLRSPWPLGNEINRVLKNGGKIYIETPNWTTMFVPSFRFHPEQHDPFNFYDDPTHIKPWSKQGIYEYLIKSCSLEVKKIGTVRNWMLIPFNFLFIIYGFIRGNRIKIVYSIWNIIGWCIYGIATKIQ